MIQTSINQAPLQCRDIEIGGELGEKLVAILKTPLMVRGHFGDANVQ